MNAAERAEIRARVEGSDPHRAVTDRRKVLAALDVCEAERDEVQAVLNGHVFALEKARAERDRAVEELTELCERVGDFKTGYTGEEGWRIIPDMLANMDDPRPTAAKAMWANAYKSGNANEWDDGEEEFWLEILDALLAARVPTPCPKCGGTGSGDGQQGFTSCPSCGGTGELPGQRLIDVLALVKYDDALAAVDAFVSGGPSEEER
jgi:hypothetical protein